MHSARNFGVEDKIHESQLVMTAVGADYATNLDAMADPANQDVTQQQKDMFKDSAARVLRREMAKPQYSNFLNRPEKMCRMTCDIPADLESEEQIKLRRGWTAQWGSVN